MEENVTIERAKQAVSEAVCELQLARIGVGSGPGARELALAVTNAQQAEMWLKAAADAREVDGTSDAPPIDAAVANGAGAVKE